MPDIRNHAQAWLVQDRAFDAAPQHLASLQGSVQRLAAAARAAQASHPDLPSHMLLPPAPS